MVFYWELLVFFELPGQFNHKAVFMKVLMKACFFFAPLQFPFLYPLH